MPELPEVETAARNLRRWSAGRAVGAVTTTGAPRLFRPQSARAAALLTGARFAAVSRSGKNLLLTLRRADGAPLGVWSHLGMTGKWLRRAAGGENPRFARGSLTLGHGGALASPHTRPFGGSRGRTAAGLSWAPGSARTGPRAR